MIDLPGSLRARAAIDASETDNAVPAIRVGRYPPYPVWMALFYIVRGAQFVFLAGVFWLIVALWAAVDGRAVWTPPIWPLVVAAALGTSSRGRWRWKLSPVGDAIGNMLASQQCPACGQNIFDHTPPSGYAPAVQQQSWRPSSVCTNCGHDLSKRTAA